MAPKTSVTLEGIYAPVEASLKAVPQTILSILVTDNDLAGDVIRHFFSMQGKLLRPALVLLGAGLFGKTENSAELIRLASSYEVFHAATLIHDDIIDSAHVRRSLPTVNIKWGPETAVLVGDFLHDRALRTIFDVDNRNIFSDFLETAGKVCDGEIHEIKVKNDYGLTEEEYFEIIDKKTAVLLSCALSAGGLYGGATPEQAQALKNYGRYFGMAFQIIDDCLDMTGEEGEFGKTLGKDLEEGVLTLPLIYLFRKVEDPAKVKIKEMFRSAIQPAQLRNLLVLLREHGAIQYALDKAAEFTKLAKEELAGFPETPQKESLIRLADYVHTRNQ